MNPSVLQGSPVCWTWTLSLFIYCHLTPEGKLLQPLKRFYNPDYCLGKQHALRALAETITELRRSRSLQNHAHPGEIAGLGSPLLLKVCFCICLCCVRLQFICQFGFVVCFCSAYVVRLIQMLHCIVLNSLGHRMYEMILKYC